MRKLLYLFIFTLVCFSCNDDFVDGPAVAFYPTGVLQALEEDGIPYQVTLSATGELNQGGVVQIEFDNHEFIETVPEHTNGVLLVDVGSGGQATFSVEALDDDLPNDYIATFKVTDTGGDISGIANSTLSFIVEDDDVANILFEDFESGLSNWEIETIAGNDWDEGGFSGNSYADVSNFRATGVTESWLVSEEIDFVSGQNEVLTFQTQTRFNDVEEIFTAYVVEGYTPGSNPATTMLTELSFIKDPHTGGGFGDFTESGEIDLSGINTTARIAFYYKAANSNDGSGWSLDNVAIQSFDPANSDGIPNDDDGGNVGGPCPSPVTKPSLSIPFTDDFESCGTVGDFQIPNGWFEVNAPGSKTDRGWGCRGFGNNDSNAPAASAFGGEDGVDDAWLISDGKFDLTGLTSASLEVWIESAFSGNGTLKILWSSDYPGEGDASCGTWTELTDFPSQLPAGGSRVWTQTTSSLSGAVGNEIFIAFRYEADNSSNVVGYNVDDLSITGN